MDNMLGITGKKVKCQKQGHEVQTLKYICLYPSKQETSRLYCDYCQIEENKKSESQVLIKEIEGSNHISEIFNWPQIKQKSDQQKIRKILKRSAKQEEKNRQLLLNSKPQIIQQIEDYFNEMTDKITQKIQGIKKSAIVKVHEKLIEIDEIEGQLQEILPEVFDTNPLKKILADYSSSENNTDFQNTNLQIEEYLSSLGDKYKEQKIKQKIHLHSIDSEKQSEKMLQGITSQTDQILKQLEKFQKSKFKAIFEGSYVNKYLPLEKSNYGNSQEEIEIEENGFQQQTVTYQRGNAGNYRVLYSEKFHRSEQLQFKFVIDTKNNNKFDHNIRIGVVKEGDHDNYDIDWGHSGNQFSLAVHGISKHPCSYNGRQVNNIIVDGQTTIVVEICISENKLEMYDTEKKGTVSNQFRFEDAEEWRFVISCGANQSVLRFEDNE